MNQHYSIVKMTKPNASLAGMREHVPFVIKARKEQM